MLICKQRKEQIEDNQEMKIISKDTFVFTSDSSQFLAQELAANSVNASGLLHLQEIYCSLLDISSEERKKLDEKLVSSFLHLNMSPDWSIFESQGELIYPTGICMLKVNNRNMFKVNNKNTRTYLITGSSVSIVNFEHVIANWSSAFI